jgi:hypothetical protein
MDDALRRGLVSFPLLVRRLEALRRPGRPGIASTRVLLDARDPATAVPESVFETRLLRTLKRAGLPPPVLQHEIRLQGQGVAVVDFAYPTLGSRSKQTASDGTPDASGGIKTERDVTS